MAPRKIEYNLSFFTWDKVSDKAHKNVKSSLFERIRDKSAYIYNSVALEPIWRKVHGDRLIKWSEPLRFN